MVWTWVQVAREQAEVCLAHLAINQSMSANRARSVALYDFWVSTTAGIASGALLAGAAWLLARVPNISGTWTVRVVTQESAFNPYKNLVVIYIAMISQHGSEVTGIAEKVFEKRIDGSEHEYVGVGRKRSEIEGGLRGNIFQKKRFQIIFREAGHLRDYASIHEVHLEHSNLLAGTFTSTAANSRGTTKWSRGIGAYNFKLLRT